MTGQQKGTILIIEDNPLNLDMAQDLLEYAGFETLQAEDAETGIQLAKRHQPDLILLDLHLPIISGYDACKIMKADPQIRDIPVVAFTALAMESDHQQALSCGCTGIINKPINVDEFAETVGALIP